MDAVEIPAREFSLGHSKLFRRLSESVGCNVEVVEDNGDVFYGLLDSFEMSKNYVILTLKAVKGLQFMNFNHVRHMRVASGRVTVPYKPSLEDSVNFDPGGVDESSRRKPSLSNES